VIERWGELGVEAVSPVHHGGDESAGNVALVRAVKVPGPDGQSVRLPIVSGNSVRGVMRRLLMRDMLAAVGYEVASPKLHHALFSGGQLEGTDDTGGLDLAFRRRLREDVPPLGLLGTAAGNDLIPGCLKVGLLVPVCAETAALLPAKWRTDERAARPVRDFLDFSFLTRRDDLGDEAARGQQMIASFEVLVAGTLFAWELALVEATPLQRACLGRAVALWAEHGTVGGKSATGHGRVRLVDPPAIEATAYADYLAGEGPRLRDALDALAARLAAKPAKAKATADDAAA
jgi:hypothetical protein